MFQAAEWSKLIHRTNHITPRVAVSPAEGSEAAEKLKQRRTQRLMQDGEVSRAFRAWTSSSGIADPGPVTKQKLQLKHPARTRDIAEQKNALETEDVGEDVVQKALWKAPRGAQPGVDGWRFEHVWDALRATTPVDAAATKLLTSLTELINKAQQGKLPDFVYKHFSRSGPIKGITIQTPTQNTRNCHNAYLIYTSLTSFTPF